MIFNTEKFIPEVYARERDMQVFTTLLNILLTSVKYDIDSLYKLYDANKCPEEFLEHLANTLNYKYNNADPVTVNRKILSIFPTMMKYKGSETGLRVATALSLTALDISKNNLETANIDEDYISALDDIKIEYNYEKALIRITYPNTYTQVRYLLDYVRPVGMRIEVLSVVPKEISERMAILAQVKTNVQEYTPERSKVDRARVNFSSPVDDTTFNISDLPVQENSNIIDMNN